MSDDLSPLQRRLYAEGLDPIEHAAWLVTMHLETKADIIEARKTNPRAYPIVKLPITLDSTVRQILASLIDAGWHPPKVRPTPEDISGFLPPPEATGAETA